MVGRVAARVSKNACHDDHGTLAHLGDNRWERLNPNGGSVAFGHTFGATGARILSQAVKELAAVGSGKRAIVSICVDGRLGTVALLQSFK